MARFFSPWIYAIGLLLIDPIAARDFGTKGYVFAIEEKPITFKPSSRSSIKDMGKSLEIKPKAVSLPEAQKDRVFYYDPSYTVPEPIRDHQGKLIARQGDTVNPLQHMAFAGAIFFDAANQEHVKWALQQHPTLQWVLVKGNPFALESQTKRLVYFDQHAFLTKKLQIERIPAKVTQEGLKLKIEECPTLKRSFS